jgi:hypothetical protein
MQTEPSAIVGTITAAVTAIIGLLVAYGFDISQDQQVAILGVTAVAAPLLASIIIRFRVFSPASTERIQQEAYAAGTPPTEPKPPLPDPPADN